MRTVVVAFALLTLAASQAMAQDSPTGNDHYVSCKSFADKSKGGDPFMRGVCAGTINALKNSGPFYPVSSRFCPPKASTVNQAAKVVVSYMDKHPEELHQSFLILAHQAMREAWPC
jgi:hypothetical protein